MRIIKSNKWKTAFKTKYGYFKYQIIRFALLNVPANFQNCINKLLAKKSDTFVIVYLDDILIYIKNAGQAHVIAIHWVLNKLKKHGLFTILKNC